MRRKEKEMTDKKNIEAVIRKCLVCRLAINDGDYPYIVPLNFGYKDDVLYFHGALKGKKISLLQKNPHVAFEFDTRLEIVKADEACNWSMKFQSVVGRGIISMLESPDEKKKALGLIMAQYSDQTFELSEKSIKGIAVYQLNIKQMTGKQSGW